MSKSWLPIKIGMLGVEEEGDESLLEQADEHLQQLCQKVVDPDRGSKATLTIKIDIKIPPESDNLLVVNGTLKISEPAVKGNALTVTMSQGEALCQTSRQIPMPYEYRDGTSSDETH